MPSSRFIIKSLSNFFYLRGSETGPRKMEGKKHERYIAAMSQKGHSHTMARHCRLPLKGKYVLLDSLSFCCKYIFNKEDVCVVRRVKQTLVSFKELNPKHDVFTKYYNTIHLIKMFFTSSHITSITTCLK